MKLWIVIKPDGQVHPPVSRLPRNLAGMMKRGYQLHQIQTVDFTAQAGGTPKETEDQ